MMVSFHGSRHTATTVNSDVDYVARCETSDYESNMGSFDFPRWEIVPHRWEFTCSMIRLAIVESIMRL